MKFIILEIYFQITKQTKQQKMDVTTALTFILPVETHEKINTIRSKYDRAYPRWVPHINFVFPFVSVENFKDLGKTLSDELEKFGSFDIELNEVGFFKQSNGYTYHLKPKDETKLRALWKKMYTALTDSKIELKINYDRFTPHVTLGQSKKNEFETRLAELKEYFKDPIMVPIKKISLISS